MTTTSHTSLRTMIRAFIAVILVVQLLGCGTILYPERRGQAAGKYDTDIVLLDAAGLLFFLVPGVIAFAVDFSTGAIYLPKGAKSRTSEIFGQTTIRQLELGARDSAGIAATIEEQTGLEINLHAPSVTILPGREGDDVVARLRELNVTLTENTRDAQGPVTRF